jgi:hypothetical protein
VITLKTHDKKKAWVWVAGLVFILTLLLTACSADTEALLLDTPTPQPAADLPEVVETEVVSEPEPPVETDVPSEVEQPTAEPTATAVEATPTTDPRIPEPELGFRRGNPELKATDPSTFVRAAGKPQLVELFAFW